MQPGDTGDWTMELLHGKQTLFHKAISLLQYITCLVSLNDSPKREITVHRGAGFNKLMLAVMFSGGPKLFSWLEMNLEKILTTLNAAGNVREEILHAETAAHIKGEKDT